MTLLSALRALASTGNVRVDKAAQEEALRLCLASHNAARRAARRPRGRREDPGRSRAEIRFGDMGLLGFMPSGWGRG